MALKAYFAHNKTWMKISVLIFFFLLSIVLLSLFLILEALLFNVSVTQLPNVMNNPVAENLPLLKLVQFTQHILIFLFPALITVYLTEESGKDFLKPYKLHNTQFYLAIPFIMLFAIPFVNILAYLNLQIEFPDFLSGFESWIRENEESTNRLIQSFFMNKTYTSLLVNIGLMAILPAIAEELIFRGVLQQYFSRLFSNIHVSVFITAALFSAMHMQFYGFIPRLFLGLLLGYLFIWTGSIWAPILAHFINNFIGVLVMHFSESPNGNAFDTIGTPHEYLLPGLLISGISFMLIGFVYKNRITTQY